MTAAALLAVTALVAPTALFVTLRARSDRRPWEIALDVPTGVALDVLSVLALALALPLDAATLASRAFWLVGSAIALRRVRRAGGATWPRALGKREVGMVLAAVAVAVGASLLLSAPYAIWDRRWHIPLVASLRGQRLPFANAYQPGVGLAYHFAGDVVASMVQALSLGAVHASLALSLVHDALFGLTGLFLGLWFVDLGARRASTTALGAALVLGTGPLTLLRGGATRPSAGYGWFAFETLSFRPHVVLAGLLLLGFFGAALARLRDPRAPVAATAPHLVATAALLAITDEASLGLAGLALGLTWLAWPETVHPKRLPGVGVFAALAAALVLPNLVFHGALSPGAPRQHVALVPWRLPGVEAASLPLSTPTGRELAAQDLFPIACAVLGGLLVAWAARRRVERGAAALLAVLSAASVFAFLRVEINHSAGESHRFLTAASLLGALLSAGWLVRHAGRAGERALGLAPAALLGLGLALPAASTLEWTIAVAPAQADKDSTFFTNDPVRAWSCRESVGARLGERARPLYVSRPVAYLYAGCRPVFTPGTPTNGWAIGVGFVEGGLAALHELDATVLGRDEPTTVICPAGKAAVADPVCEAARAAGPCAAEGRRVARCTLPAAERHALVARTYGAAAR